MTETSAKYGSTALQTHKWVMSNEEIVKDFDKVPAVKICQFCGKELYTKGIMLNPHKVTWLAEPEPCTCEMSVKFNKELAEKELKQNLENIQKQKHNNIRQDINKLIGISSISPRAKDCTFDNFILYDDEYKRFFNIAQSYVKDFGAAEKKNSLFLTGNTGTGKSFMSFCIVNALINSGIPVIAMTDIEILERIRNAYESKNYTIFEILKIYKDVPLLCIDDLGKEKPKEWGLSKLYSIINYRHEHYKPVLINTNYTDKELINRLTPEGSTDTKTAEAIIDRLRGTCKAVIFSGKSLRG